jgi:hypothetical protein
MQLSSLNFSIVKNVLLVLLCNVIFVPAIKAQTNQVKAEQIVKQYLSRNLQSVAVSQNIKFHPIQVLRSSFEETDGYKDLLQKVDNLKIEGTRIDARIAKMKTKAELNKAEKDSEHLSKELIAASDKLVRFMTSYKGGQIGWLLKASNSVKSKNRNSGIVTKTFFLNQELSHVDSAK